MPLLLVLVLLLLLVLEPQEKEPLEHEHERTAYFATASSRASPSKPNLFSFHRRAASPEKITQLRTRVN